MKHFRPHDFGPEHMDRIDRFGGGMFFGGFLYLLLLGLLVTAVVLLAVNMRRTGGVRPAVQGPPVGPGAVGTRDPAIETARMRLAQGEISREEFDEINRALGGGGPSSPLERT